MNIENPYLPADKQNIDNITTLSEDEEEITEIYNEDISMVDREDFLVSSAMNVFVLLALSAVAIVSYIVFMS